MERPSPNPLPTWRERARKCGAVSVVLAVAGMLVVGCSNGDRCTPGARRDCVGTFCGGTARCDSWCTAGGIWGACMCPIGVPCDAGMEAGSADAASVDADGTAPETCNPSVDVQRECAFCGYPFNCGCRERCMPDGTWGPCFLAYEWVCDTGP
jgi:hypothetical protein